MYSKAYSTHPLHSLSIVSALLPRDSMAGPLTPPVLLSLLTMMAIIITVIIISESIG
jgi:hypothetical protein